MTADEFKVEWFKLEENANASPNTGIKINLDGLHYYDLNGNDASPYNYSTFRFADNTASKNADLTNIIVSSGEKNDEEADESTYKEYSLDPEFDKDTTNYEIELLEYKDTLDIKAILSDTESTMKIKVPKRDEDDNLLYEEDGTTIIYEEKDLTNDTLLEVIINKLGEPDTKLTIVVTAEDKSTTKEYELVIKRPYGIIKGKAVLADFDEEERVENLQDTYGITVDNKISINLYKSDLKIPWETITDIFEVLYENHLTYEQLEENYTNEATYKSNDDGTYEIYVVPGTYDVQCTRLAYLDYLYLGVVVNANDEIDMETFNMPAGDAVRDGVITQEDINILKQTKEMDKSDPNFSDSYDPTQTGMVMQEDIVYAKNNKEKELTIKYFK